MDLSSLAGEESLRFYADFFPPTALFPPAAPGLDEGPAPGLSWPGSGGVTTVESTQYGIRVIGGFLSPYERKVLVALEFKGIPAAIDTIVLSP